MSNPTARKAMLGLTLVVSGLVVGLALGEAALRIAGFKYAALPKVQFGSPTPRQLADSYLTDPDLLWTEKDYADRVKAAIANPPIVVFMGDSCVQFSKHPALALELLAKEAPAVGKGIKVGVGGWSSQQGRWQLERDVLPMKPKIITVEYGWNDHWVAMGPPDKDARPGPFAYWLSTHSRLYQLSMMARIGIDLHMESRHGKRVEIDDYRANLTAIANEAKAAGIIPVLVAAPSNHVVGKEPQYLTERWLTNISDLVPLHQSYLAVTREVAASTGAVLCDAAALIEPDPKRADYFINDGIHFSPPGDERMARIVADCIKTAATNARL